MPNAGRLWVGVPLVGPQTKLVPAEKRTVTVVALVIWWSDSQRVEPAIRVMFAGGLLVPMKLPWTVMVSKTYATVWVTAYTLLLTSRVNRNSPGEKPASV